MADNPEEARARADAKLKMTQARAREGEKAWAEHNAAAQATRKKTARLRAERLAREAAESETGATKRPPSPRKRKSP